VDSLSYNDTELKEILVSLGLTQRSAKKLTDRLIEVLQQSLRQRIGGSQK